MIASTPVYRMKTYANAVTAASCSFQDPIPMQPDISTASDDRTALMSAE